MRRLFGFVVLLAVLWWGVGQWRASGDTRWTSLGDGLEMRTYYMQEGTSRVQVHAFRAAPRQVHVIAGDVLNAKGWLRQTKARAVINGGYFDNSTQPLGLRVSQGKKVSSLRKANWGVFYIRNGVARISHTDDYRGATTTMDAVQCGPRLVVNGKTTDLKNQWGRRSGVGIDRAGRVVLAIADGDVSLDAWAQQWALRSSLDCPNALNLDGGGSTQMAAKAGDKSYEVSGLWPVPDVLVIR